MKNKDEFEDFDVKILNGPKIINNQLRVEVETQFGTKKFGFSSNDKYIDPYTRKPRWMGKLYNALQELYSKDNCTEEDVSPECTGQIFKLSDLQPEIVRGMEKFCIKRLGLSKEKAKEVADKYKNFGELRDDILAGKKLPFNKATNDILKDYFGGDRLGFSK